MSAQERLIKSITSAVKNEIAKNSGKIDAVLAEIKAIHTRLNVLEKSVSVKYSRHESNSTTIWGELRNWDKMSDKASSLLDKLEVLENKKAAVKSELCDELKIINKHVCALDDLTAAQPGESFFAIKSLRSGCCVAELLEIQVCDASRFYDKLTRNSNNPKDTAEIFEIPKIIRKGSPVLEGFDINSSTIKIGMESEQAVCKDNRDELDWEPIDFDDDLDRIELGPPLDPEDDLRLAADSGDISNVDYEGDHHGVYAKGVAIISVWVLTKK